MISEHDKKKNDATIAGAVPGTPPQEHTQVTPEMNEERYKTFLDSIEDGCYELDLKGNLTFFNSRLTDISGYTAEEMMGKNYQEYTEAGTARDLFEAYNRVFMTGLPSKGLEWVLIRKDGSRIFLESSVSLITDSHANPTGFRGIVRDISERKRTEEALRESQQMLRLVLDTIPTRVFWKDRDLIYQGCNRQLANDAGLASPEEITGKDDFAMVWSDRAELYRADDRSVIETGIPKLDYEEQETTPDGGMKWVRTNKIPFLDAQGTVNGILGTFEDITERKRMEETLRDSREYLNAIINCIGDPVFVNDQQHRYVLVNKAFAELLGRPRDGIIGKTNHDFFQKEQVDVFWKFDDEVFETGLETMKEEFINNAHGQVLTVLTKKTLFTDRSDNKYIVGVIHDITDRKWTEATLRESEIRYRTLFQASSDGILIADFETKAFKYANPAACRLLGYSVTELTTMDIAAIHPKTDLPRVMAEFEAQARGDKTLAADLPCLRKDGTTVYADVIASAMTIDGRVCNVGFFRDITERKRTEEALTKSEMRFHTLYESSSDAVMLLDENGFFDCNASTLRLFGCIDKATFCSKHPADCSPTRQPCGTDSMDLAKQRILTAMETGTNRFEWIHKRLDTGKEFPCEVLLSRMSLDGHTVLQATVRDITERRRTEEALLQGEKRFRLVAQSANDAFITSDNTGSILFWNVMAEKIFGYKAEEMLGRDVSVIISPWFRDEFTNFIRMSIHTMKKAITSEITPIGRTAQMMGLRKDGSEFPVEISSSIWESDEKYLCTSIIRDISERTRLEDSLRREAEELRKARMEREKAFLELQTTHAHVLQQEKMASIGQLAAGVAHEINNPMGFISSNLGTLRKYLDKRSEYMAVLEQLVEQVQDQAALAEIKEKRKELKIDFIAEDIRDLINESLEGADRVKKIVQDLKSFSRIDQSEYKYANINECMETTINIVWNELKYKATINKDYGDIPLTKCYPQQINQVFMNLLVNAAQAIEKQGVITIRTWKGDSFILASISDTGCGMEPAIVNRIFEPFFTTKEVGKGTGLGLSITYDIVKKHGGEIDVQTAPGEGTTFTVRIPIVEET